ncbi:MAG: hypothetical protein JWN14_1516 [Chthonomonadales bacterium]|nr:hypothetical protein [Chthonomonadales bacterium]
MRRAAVLFVAIGLAGGISGRAQADGTIILNNAPSFQTAIDSTNITGNGNTVGTQNTASNSALTTAFPNTSDIKVSSNVTSNAQLNGLLSYAPTLGAGQSVSSWTYGYHIDPDLTNYTINLQVYLPEVGVFPSAHSAGINDITIALTSVTKDSSNQDVYSTRAWGWDNNLSPGILNPDPITHLEDFSLAAIDGFGAGGSNFFVEDPTFDIRNVWYVSIGYRGTVDGSFPTTPLGNNALWIGTEQLIVTSNAGVADTPEPGTVAFITSGLLGAGFLQYSRRMRARRRKG